MLAATCFVREKYGQAPVIAAAKAAWLQGVVNLRKIGVLPPRKSAANTKPRASRGGRPSRDVHQETSGKHRPQPAEIPRHSQRTFADRLPSSKFRALDHANAQPTHASPWHNGSVPTGARD